MPISLIDLRTLILLMVISNLFTVGVLVSFEWGKRRQRHFQLYIAGKLVLATAFLLVGLRDYIPIQLSFLLGNVLVFVGFALEASALGILLKVAPGFEKWLAVTVTLGTGVFLAWSETVQSRTVTVSLVLMILSLQAFAAVARINESTRPKQVVMGYTGLMALALALRAGAAFLNGEQVRTPLLDLALSLLFLPTFLFMLMGGVLFLVLINYVNERNLQLAHTELLEQEALLKTVFNASRAGIFLINEQARFTMANQSLADMLGIVMDKLTKSCYLDFLPQADRAEAQSNIHKLINATSSDIEVQRHYVRADGQRFWGQLSGNRFLNPTTGQAELIGVLTDISELKQAEARIRELAQHDALTGLANRTLLSDRLQQAISIAQRDKKTFAVAYLDLDGFKAVNDVHGHAAGDLLLVQMALRLKTCVRESDTVARVGGDEFVLLLHSVDSAQSAQTVVDKIKEVLSEAVILQSLPLQVTCSIGIALYPDDGATESNLLRHADTAMYAAKARKHKA